jgi:hypothetical protein
MVEINSLRANIVLALEQASGVLSNLRCLCFILSRFHRCCPIGVLLSLFDQPRFARVRTTTTTSRLALWCVKARNWSPSLQLEVHDPFRKLVANGVDFCVMQPCKQLDHSRRCRCSDSWCFVVPVYSLRDVSHM